MTRRMKSKQSGFTLVELSIVLVIIGLIIGGVLTGQQIIQNARVTNAINAVQSYAAQVQTYNQNYGALPGDDANAPARFTGTAGVAAGNGDGVVGTVGGALVDSFAAPGAENLQAWAHLRAAGLIKNQTPITGQPPNPFNGVFSLQNGAFTGSAGALTTTVLCLNNVPGAAALTIDTRLDDGASGTGNMQGSITGPTGAVPAAAAGSTYDPTKTYTLCMKM